MTSEQFLKLRNIPEKFEEITDDYLVLLSELARGCIANFVVGAMLAEAAQERDVATSMRIQALLMTHLGNLAEMLREKMPEREELKTAAAEQVKNLVDQLRKG